MHARNRIVLCSCEIPSGATAAKHAATASGRFWRLIAALLVLVGWVWSAWPAAAAQSEPPDGSRPNILLILVDDLGKEWISCYGAEGIQTPHIDRLAATGMRFENAWCMPQCTPTRVTLLTGQYPFRHGWTNHFDVPRWGSGCHFDPELNASFALVLRRAGYATAIAGKWQIDDFRIEPRALDEAGFDQWCVWTGGEGGNPVSGNRYWDPYIHMGEKSRSHPGKFGPDIYCQFLIDFMHAHRDGPMLLYYPMCLVHGPATTTPDEPNVEGKLERHKAMVRYMDKLVGRLVGALDELDLRRRTIIIFTTDNGSGGGLTGRRLGHQVRGGKAKMNEAGTAMPFVVNCPGLVPSGVVTEALTDFTDILPTLAELAGTQPDGRFAVDGHSIAGLLLGKAEDSPREWIFSMGGHPASFRDNRVVPAQRYDDRVIRDRRWKLWVGTNRQPEALYDMKADPWETNNLIASPEPEAEAAKQRLWAVIERQPTRDAAPRYRPNPPQPWDRFDYRGPADSRKAAGDTTN